MRTLLLSTLVLAMTANLVRADVTTLDDLLADGVRLNTFRNIATALMSLGDPKASDEGRKAMRDRFWASQSTVKIDDAEREAELKKFDASLTQVADLLRQREIGILTWGGIDPVLLGNEEDWYFAASSMRGPVLIRVSLQEIKQGERITMGLDVTTDWDKVKSTAAAIKIPAGKQKLFTIYTPAQDRKPTSTPPDGKL